MGIVKTSPDGLINDVETQMLRMVEEAFRRDENLKYIERPRIIEDVNPGEVEITDIPALYVWCTGFGRDINTMGARPQEISRKFEFYCNVQYIIPKLEERRASKELRKVAWWLFNVVDGNLDLDGWVQGNTQMQDVDLFPRLMLVGGKVMPVSSVNIKIIYPFVDRQTIVKNSNKYLR